MIAQTIAFAIAAWYLARTLYTWHRSNAVFHASLALALLSPIMLGGSRVILTELLTSATTLWLMAEFLRSMLEDKPRTMPIAAAVCAGLMMRWDQITLLVPTGLGLIAAFGWRRALSPMLKILALCSVPYLALMIRASLVGLPLLPSTIALEAELPRGAITFFRVAALDERATRDLVWPVIARKYSTIALDPGDAYSTRVDTEHLRRLLAELAQIPTGGAVPPQLDSEFSTLARRVSENWLATQLGIPLIRAGRIWSRWWGHQVAFSSFGEKPPVRQALIAYSALVALGLLIGAWLGSRPLRSIAAIGVLLAASRTAFLVIIPISALEIRYLDPLFPALDMIAISAFWLVIQRQSSIPFPNRK